MKTILMTSPVNFSVQYEINPWMEGNIGTVDITEAVRQWSDLRNSLIASGATVIVLPKSPQYCPDAVFIANAGLVMEKNIILSKFKHEERAPEEHFFHDWFSTHGFKVIRDETDRSRNYLSFEGAGDALLDKKNSILWYGINSRSSLTFKPVLDEFFDDTSIIVRPLELIDPRFYHLDTCFCPLDTGEILWFPEAFSDYSRGVVESWYKDKQIAVTETDAVKFACNAVSVGSTIVLPSITPFLKQTLKSRGYTAKTVEMDAFLKSGGACKCLTLEIL